jgi:hypothetical protein
MSHFRLIGRGLSRLAIRMRSTLPAMLLVAFAPGLHAQSAPAPAPDVIVFTNGDQLTGKFVHELGGQVTFHSDVVGDITVGWDKIKTLHSSQNFAVIQKGQIVNPKKPDTDVAKGAIAVETEQVKVTQTVGGEKEIPTANTAFMIDQPTYEKELHSHPGVFHGWNGSVTAGATLVEATQNSRGFTGAVGLVRTVPNVSWLSPRNRTIVDFNSAYGEVTQPGTPSIKTNILHFDAERDWFLTQRLYALADMSLDHNYSQGLQLQQIYGGGLGYTLIKTPKQELDLKGDIHYERQTFFLLPNVAPPVTASRNLIGASFGDIYMVKLPKGMVLNQATTITPAFNQPDAWSATTTAALLFPVYKGFGFSLGILDDYLNTPAAGSKSNSFQFTAGVTYTIK